MGHFSRTSTPTTLKLAALNTESSPVHATSASPDSPSLFSSKRTGSCSTDSSGPEPFSPTLRRTPTSWIKPSPTVNVHTTCGRHSDQLLFHGPSLSGLARTLFKKS